MKKVMGFILLLLLGIGVMPFTLSEAAFSPLAITNRKLPCFDDARVAQGNVREENIRDLFPCFTLYDYESLNSGTLVLASYYSISNDTLTLKHVRFAEGGMIVYEVDTMPIPLSVSALHALESAPLEDVIDLGDRYSAFPVANILDMNRIPVHGKILQADMQKNFLILLVEDEAGNRRVQLVSIASSGEYQVYASTSVLPIGTTLDLFHSTDGEIYFQWDGQKCEAGYARTVENEWCWSWSKMHSADATFEYSAVYCGISMGGPWTEGNRDHLLVGSMKNTSLSNADLSLLPKAEDELKIALNRDEWAIVKNPTSTNGSHLRVSPNADSESLGKFYHGTPLQVVEQKGDWTKVAVGLDGLSGWMMTRQLAFGDKMDQVKPAFPQKIYREALEKEQPAYPSRQLKSRQKLEGYIHIVGVVNEEWYVLLTSLGHTGYVPQAWMWDGNG
ncbi:MAG: SH3 domain-containing protein [Clostridia bacterium]